MNFLNLMNSQNYRLTIIIIIMIVPLLFSNCENSKPKKTEQSNSKQIKQETNDNNRLDTTAVKKWLDKVIIDYGNGSDLKLVDHNLTLALTDDYYKYKLEAITLEYSDMTWEEFERKWESKYNTSFVGNGVFFGLTPDHGNIEISSCNLLNTFGDSSQIYRVIIRDTHWKINYLTDIKIVSRGQKLLIDDIIELE